MIPPKTFLELQFRPVIGGFEIVWRGKTIAAFYPPMGSSAWARKEMSRDFWEKLLQNGDWPKG